PEQAPALLPESQKNRRKRPKRATSSRASVSKLIVPKTGARQSALRLFALHELAPDEARAKVLRHEHGDSGIDSDHVGVEPVDQWIERVDESVARPGARFKTVLDIVEDPQRRFRHERQRASGGARHDGSIDGSDRRRTSPDGVSIARVGSRDSPQV